MNKDRSYFVFLEALEKPGCPICHLVLEDSRGYLDSLMYERVLDVPTRLDLMNSFGFCSWHAWQIPALPAICNPIVGFSIFASDLLRKFDHLTHAMLERNHNRQVWKLWFKKTSHRLFSRMKSKACPVCVHVAQAEFHYLRELADFLSEEQFLSVYRASAGICLPHFFREEHCFSDHANFPLLARSQFDKVQSLRSTIDEFIRKQDHRFSDQITSCEAQAWRVTMEFLVGKPGVFNNEMRHELVHNSRQDGLTAEEVSKGSYRSNRVSLGESITKINSAQEVTVYLKRPLPSQLFNALRESLSFETHPTIAVVVEDFVDVSYLRALHAAGFRPFYGLGLPNKTLLFLGSNLAFLIEDQPKLSGLSVRGLQDPQSVYFRLLWRRFGHAVLLSGSTKDRDLKGGLFSLAIDGGKEQWCRLKNSTKAESLPLGIEIEIFAWDKWVSPILEVLEVTVLERR